MLLECAVSKEETKSETTAETGKHVGQQSKCVVSQTGPLQTGVVGLERDCS